MFSQFFPSRVYQCVAPNQIVLHEQTVEPMPQDIRSNNLIDILKTIKNEEMKLRSKMKYLL